MNPRNLQDNAAEGAIPLQEIFDTLISPLQFEEVLDRILEIALRELDADQGSLLLLEGEARVLKMLASRGLPEEIARRGYVPREGSISEYVIREKKPLVVNDVPREAEYQAMEDEKAVRRRIRSAVCVPLIVRGNVIGTMNLNRTGRKDQFAQRDLNTCAIIASQSAIVIENRRLQSELMQSERLAAVGEVVAGLSHCMKNILAGVRGGLSLTESGLKNQNGDGIQQGFEILKRNTNTMSNLILDLLDYSKEREPLRQSFSLATVLENVISTVSYKAEILGVEIRKEFPEEIDYFGDKDQVFRAVLNLVTNAIEAAAETSRPDAASWVTVRAQMISASEASQSEASGGDAEWLKIEVSDSGPGIAEEKRHLVWNLFYSTKGSKGTGLGLATTRKMIEEHGGCILVDSPLGQGAVFSILLPPECTPKNR